MTTHLTRALEILKCKTFTLVAMVEDNLSDAVKTIQNRDENKAVEVINKDTEIDDEEVSVEEECLKILALHQPVAIDLRFIIAVLKLNSDLERIGDLAVNIAERSIYISKQPMVPIAFDFDDMAEKVIGMLRKSIDALINTDEELAVKVCESDDEVDEINRDVYKMVKEKIIKHPEHLDALINLLSVSRHLERIADHATNIAEDVIYLVKGDIVRHTPDI